MSEQKTRRDKTKVQGFLHDVKEFADEYTGALPQNYMNERVEYSVPTAVHQTFEYDSWDEVLEEAGAMTQEDQNDIFNTVRYAKEHDVEVDWEKIMKEKGYEIEDVEELLGLDNLNDL